MKKCLTKKENAIAIKKLCELYRKNPERVTFTIKYKNTWQARKVSEICIALDIEGLSVKSILNLDLSSKCELIVNNNTRIPEIEQKLTTGGPYASQHFATNVYRHVRATYAEMPLSRKDQNAIINAIEENANNIKPIVGMYSSETMGYKVTIGTDASIKTDRRYAYTGPQRCLMDLTVVNKNPELPLPAHISMPHMAVSNPKYIADAEFAGRVNQLMHDLYMAQNQGQNVR